jgi:hypothetical protein
MRPALPRFALLRWTRALAAWLMISCARRAAEPLSFYVNYAATVPTAPLVAHPLSNVHPDARVHLAAAQAAANTIPTYPSVGEMAGGAPYRGAARARGLADERWYGVGFTAAAGLGAAVAGHYANRSLARLEYQTFTSQPLHR